MSNEGNVATSGSDETKEDVIDVEQRAIVTYGSRIKLEHLNTQYRLHSHKHDYPNGSKQQQVTCYSKEDDNDYWVVKPSVGNQQSLQLWQKPVQNGQTFMLQHYCTAAYLHSHENIASAVTNQQEVTAHWNPHDNNSNWRLEVTGDNEGSIWKRGPKIKLIHANTNVALHSHSHKYPNQQEVTGFAGRDANDFWFVSKVEKEAWYL